MTYSSKVESPFNHFEETVLPYDKEGALLSTKLSEYALSVDLDTIHPARLFVVRAALNELMVNASTDEMRHLQKAFFRTLYTSRKIIPEFQETLRNNEYCKTELLEALNFELLTPSSIERFFSFIISPELFNSSASVQTNDPEIPSHCFDFISFCPQSIVRAIAARGADTIKSFHDLGCGPGSIMFIVAILTDAQVSGTELSSALCSKGRVLADLISRADIEFINRDLCDDQYSFAGYQLYYCYSPFIWKVKETYTFARNIESSIQEESGEIWMGDYLPMCEVIEEGNQLEKVANHGRLSVYKKRGVNCESFYPSCM